MDNDIILVHHSQCPRKKNYDKYCIKRKLAFDGACLCYSPNTMIFNGKEITRKYNYNKFILITTLLEERELTILVRLEDSSLYLGFRYENGMLSLYTGRPFFDISNKNDNIINNAPLLLTNLYHLGIHVPIEKAKSFHSEIVTLINSTRR